jgi:hypothetical protein
LRCSIAVGSCVLLLAWRLRKFAYLPDPSLHAQLQLTSGVLAFTFAAIALVRFRGTRDRLPLILASGFVIVGTALARSAGRVLSDAAAGPRPFPSAPWQAAQYCLYITLPDGA